MTVPFAFANLSGNIALAKLDSNFNTPITIGNTSVLLGNTITTINNVTLANVTISSGTASNISLTSPLAVSSGGTGSANLTVNNVLIGNGTSAVTSVAPGTTGNVLTSIGGAWVSNVALTSVAAGSNTQVQYNSANLLAGSANLTFDGTNLGVGSSPLANYKIYATGAIRSSGSATYPSFSVDGLAGIWGPGSDTMAFIASGTEGMRLTSTGLGIGTSSPVSALTLTNTKGLSWLNASGNFSVTAGSQIVKGADNNLNFDSYDGAAVFRGASFAERMRLDTSGNLLVGDTTAWGLIASVCDASAQNCFAAKNTGTTYGSSTLYARWINSSNATAGSIQHTAATTVNYNTSSDERLKSDMGVATDMSVIDNTIIHDFTWKEDGRVDRGVFAQEAHQVKPSAISVGTDELTESGTLATPWGVDYSKYVPDLIVYCQQLKQQVQSLTNRIAQLEAKP